LIKPHALDALSGSTKLSSECRCANIVSETLARGTGWGKSARPDLWGARVVTSSPTRQDAKGECGLGDYQALSWQAWHHHVSMVMLAMLFIAEQRAAQSPGLDLLSPRDIVDMLKETLPRKPEGKDALARRINERHQRRLGAIQSRFRPAAKSQPP
jgi:hypothetical protein